MQRILPAVLAVVASSALLAQQTTFHTAVQYVTVDVVVTDRRDKPVDGLTKDDFEIVENGTLQTIADFRQVVIPVAPRALKPGGPVAPDPDVATNIPPSADSRLFAIVVDNMQLIEQDLVRIKRTLVDLVNALSPDDQVALVFSSRSDFSVNFTRNHTRLLERIDHLKDVMGFGLDALPYVDSPSPAGAVSKPSRFLGAINQSSNDTLGSVVRSLGGSGHTRRAVFLVTGGGYGVATNQDRLAVNPNNAESAVTSALVGTDASWLQMSKLYDVPIYPIDPRGNMEPENAVRGGLGGGVTTLADPGLNALVRQYIRKQHDGLAEVAVNTGGRAVFNTQNMTKMVREFVQENGRYYLLGYYPAPYAADGVFHEIKVHVKRPGLRVRARQGYEAEKPAGTSGAIDDTMERSITAGVNVAGLPMRAFAQPIASDGTRMTIGITVDVEYPVPAGKPALDEHLQFRVLALDPDAKVLARAARNVDIRGTLPEAGAASITINDTLEVPIQPQTIRIAVGGTEVGKAGSVQMLVDLPTDRGVSLGGLAVGVVDRNPVAALTSESLEALVPFHPLASRQFTAADTLRVFGHAYWSTGADPVLSATLTGPGAATAVAIDPQISRDGDGRADARLDFTLPLAGKPAGAYRLTVRAAVPRGKTLTRDVLFDVR